MLRNVTDPKEIPKQVKTKAKRLLKGQIKEGMCLLAAQTFLQRRFDDTLKLADALKQDFKLKNPASLFKRAVRSSQKSPSSHSRIYRSLERKFAKPQKTAQKKLLQKRFGGYAKYLLLENS